MEMENEAEKDFSGVPLWYCERLTIRGLSPVKQYLICITCILVLILSDPIKSIIDLLTLQNRIQYYVVPNIYLENLVKQLIDVSTSSFFLQKNDQLFLHSSLVLYTWIKSP